MVDGDSGCGSHRGCEIYVLLFCCAFQDVPANAENTKIFITLRPSWTYSVAVAAFNADGMGPYAIINVTTPVARQNPNPAVDSPDTVLIYGTESELRLYDRHHLWHDQPTVFPFDSSVLENLPPPTTETVFHGTVRLGVF